MHRNNVGSELRSSHSSLEKHIRNMLTIGEVMLNKKLQSVLKFKVIPIRDPNVKAMNRP